MHGEINQKHDGRLTFVGEIALYDNITQCYKDERFHIKLNNLFIWIFSDTPNCGPVHWIHFNYVCPNCVSKPGNECCFNNPTRDVNFCRPDPGRETYHASAEGDNNVNGGCEAYRLISGVDSMALPCGVGLYYDFQVTEDGIPYGCPGFTPGWIGNGRFSNCSTTFQLNF